MTDPAAKTSALSAAELTAMSEHLYDYQQRGGVIEEREARLLATAEAFAARIAALERALLWAMAPNPRHEGRHRTEPRCSTFMPTDADCNCGYTEVSRVLLATTPPTAEYQPLVETVEEFARRLAAQPCEFPDDIGCPADIGDPCDTCAARAALTLGDGIDRRRITEEP